MKRFFAGVLVALLLLAVVHPVASSALAEKEYKAQRFDVEVDVGPDGTLLVTETVVFEFTGGPFTRVFRELPDEKVDRVEVVSAALDGQALDRGDEAGQVEISGGTPIEVVWHLPPTSDETHTFTLTYRVEGALEQVANADHLVWQALPEEREYPIDASRVTVTYPAGAGLAGEPQVEYGTATVETTPGRVIFQARDVDAGDLLIVQVLFEPGSLIAAPPEWQAQQERARAAAPFFIALGLGVLVVGVVVVLFYLNRHRRPPHEKVPPVPAWSQPPGELPPAFAGALVGDPSSWNNALATLFDLARRGVVRFVELPGEKKWYEGPPFELRLEEEPRGLLPHEQGLLAALFETKKGKERSLDISELGGRYTSHSDRFREPLQREMVKAGLVDPERAQVRRRLLVGGGVVCLVAGVGFTVAVVIGALTGLWPAMAVPGGLLLVGVVALIAGAFQNTLSMQGLEAAARWQAFSRHVRDVTRDEAPASPSTFEPYLPYAAAFGHAEAWVKHFEKQDKVPIPAWFDAVSDGSAAWVALLAATSATSSAGAAAGGAAAGAAGGGASGAS